MHNSQPSYLSVSLGANNNADKMASYSQCYGCKRTPQSLVSNFTSFTASNAGADCDINRQYELPSQCVSPCNVSNVLTRKLAPIQCGQLSETINDQATKLHLRSELPHLTRKDVAQIRLPFYQLLCHALLENGYHRAFSELFGLHQKQNEERRLAGPESPLWYIPPLAEQPEKVTLMAHHLSEAEAASRRRDAHTVFTSYLTLGLTFKESPDDLWLAEHFFKYTLEAAVMITDDDNLKLAIAHQHYGHTLQVRGFLEQASVSLKEFYRLTREKLWRDDKGQLLQKLASTYLVENFQSQIAQCPSHYHSDRITLCRKAHEIALECGDWKIEAPIWLLVGEILESANNLQEALVVYRDFFDKACTRGDYTNLSRVCEALAKLCQKLNNIEDSIQYLHKFASSCERHGQWVELGRACQMLGTAYDTVGDYASALKWMKKAYNLPHMIQGLKPEAFDETTESSRIMIGVTRAHLMHKAYVTNMLNNQSPAVYRVIEWKARPKNEDKLFPINELQLPPITFNNRRPKRDVLLYAKHPSTGFLKR
ncbi:hypothetical protein EG68_03358 [Paragonimus skrjabini miyazakii]|uniref:Tetratricopeptide repeat protein 29 n=1 Tax=Paragonimus skrjabini miyazakii TaxID=59628 RepID=A0A8S9YXA4_9TREM|nr:hypothetical protein EG68_03358 [Paragonimus skrjabini miyazakii]